jgi:hypothetical protein
MTKGLRRVAASVLVATAVLSAGAAPIAASASRSGHAAMPCCDEPDECAARLSAVSCCAPGQAPDATAPTPVAVSVTIAKVAHDLPSAQPVGGIGLLSRAASEAFDLACLKLPQNPPYLLHSVFLI